MSWSSGAHKAFGLPPGPRVGLLGCPMQGQERCLLSPVVLFQNIPWLFGEDLAGTG